MPLDCGRKAQHLERTHRTWEHTNSTQTGHGRRWSRTQDLAERPQFTTVPPRCPYSFFFSVTYSSRVHKPIADLRRAVPIFFIQSLLQTHDPILNVIETFATNKVEICKQQSATCTKKKNPKYIKCVEKKNRIVKPKTKTQCDVFEMLHMAPENNTWCHFFLPFTAVTVLTVTISFKTKNRWDWMTLMVSQLDRFSSLDWKADISDCVSLKKGGIRRRQRRVVDEANLRPRPCSGEDMSRKSWAGARFLHGRATQAPRGHSHFILTSFTFIRPGERDDGGCSSQLSEQDLGEVQVNEEEAIIVRAIHGGFRNYFCWCRLL